ncbi:GNAT family N-acetyltransferase [Bradyrhizobium sp. UFLA05-112]
MTRTILAYRDSAADLQGVLVADESAASRHAGVVLFPDTRGIGTHAIARAEQLAALGFTVLVADLYGGGKTAPDVPQAIELMNGLRADTARWRERAEAARLALAGQDAVEATKLAAIGYCFGGSTALELARTGADLAAVVSFHGGFPNKRPEDAANIKARVLVCHGAADVLVSLTQLANFARDQRRLAGPGLWRRGAWLHQPRARWRKRAEPRLSCRRGSPLLGRDARPVRRGLCNGDALNWRRKRDMPSAHLDTAAVRLLTPADAASYRQIRLEALEAHPGAYSSVFVRERDMALSWFEERLTASDVFGAFIEQELCGVAGFRRQDGTKTVHKAVLWGMYVRPAARSFGVGRRLVDAVVAHAAQRVEQLQLSVVSDNEPALRLYTSAGFIEYGREPKALKQDGRYFDEILMKLFLDGGTG